MTRFLPTLAMLFISTIVLGVCLYVAEQPAKCDLPVTGFEGTCS